MADEAQSTNEGFSIPEEARPEAIAFKESVAKADGTLITLRKETPDGRTLYITTRNIKNPTKVKNPDANPSFYGWRDSDEPMDQFTNALLIDTYVGDGEKIVPLGHMDWWIHDDYANGGGNMHEAGIPKSEHEQLSRQRWKDAIGFKVEYGHHQRGLGSLMLATSAVTLQALGVRNFYPGGLLEPAKRTYSRFGIQDKNFPHTKNPWDRHLPIERLSQHPQINKTIGEFV
ncbi:hypothetical protein A2165_02270 [Candidatus Curtissbacteria bacterium RBG_13_40_7]|uniref:Uncharacterized protein n=1 Tax=Candidatus Curtissbacteria bacterium RBG_13_40_7 TaxID=1797706 RepID=A0A1F5FYD7_9BACT|nr:MAG: hypothetical protein A2165_02270 [Candidatus Curtissbacteria bacterium RBG_13_40_7]